MQRVRAVVLSEQGLNVREIARKLARSTTEIKHWTEDYREGGLKKLFPVEKQRAQRSYQVFTNLLVARLAEDLFAELISRRLKPLGISAVDRREEYTETDYAIVDYSNKDLLLINVKVHSSKFEQAKRFVGLDPDDTFPLAVYKILMGFKYERQTSLPFVFIVSLRWGLVDEVMRLLSPQDSQLIDLIFQTRTPGRRKAEDRLVSSIVEKLRISSNWSKLLRMLEDEGTHRVISAKKALDLFLDKFEERCPGLSLRQFAAKFAGRRGTPAEINMHLSISNEMTSLDRFLNLLQTESMEDISRAIRDGNI